jgi:hypothetical protein
LIFAGRSTERERMGAEESAPLQELREPAFWLEGDST